MSLNYHLILDELAGHIDHPFKGLALFTGHSLEANTRELLGDLAGGHKKNQVVSRLRMVYPYYTIAQCQPSRYQ
jgi:hypothetical protein